MYVTNNVTVFLLFYFIAHTTKLNIFLNMFTKGELCLMYYVVHVCVYVYMYYCSYTFGSVLLH